MKTIKKLLLTLPLLLVSLACLVLGVACGGTEEELSIEITGVPKNTVYYQSGGVIALDYKITPADALVTVEWSSSDKNVATVRNGRVTHKGVGTTTITATIKDTEISDSVQITLEEQPKLSITVDGEEQSVGYRIDGKGIENAVLDLDKTDTANKTLLFNTDGEEIVNPTLTAVFATGEELEPETLYEMTYTLTFDSGSNNDIPKLTAGLRTNTNADWWHVANWEENQIDYTAPMNFQVLFTTPATFENSHKVELLGFASGSTYAWKGGLSIQDVNVKKVDATNITHYIENKSALEFILFDGDELYGTEEPEAKKITISSGLTNFDDSTYFAHAAIRRVWSVSDPEILELISPDNGNVIVKNVGKVTVTSTIFGIEGLSDSWTITIGDTEPEKAKLKMMKNGSEVNADIRLIEGENDFTSEAITISDDCKTMTVDTSTLGRAYTWFNLQLKLASGEELKDNTLYYLSYTLKINDLSDATSAWFTAGAPTATKNRIDIKDDTWTEGNTYQVKGIFATGEVGVTEGYSDNGFVYLYSNSDSNNSLKSFKIEISDLVFEEAEESTSGQKGNTGLSNIYALIGWDHIGKVVGDTLTFAHNAIVFLPTNIYDSAYPETIVDGVRICEGITFKWASSDTAVVNFTDEVTGASEFLSAGDTTISLYAVLPDGAEHLLCARDITVTE